MSELKSNTKKTVRIGARDLSIPDDWDAANLHDLIDISGSGEWGEEVETETNTKQASVLRSGDITLDGKLSTEDIATRYLSEEDYKQHAIEPLDIVIVSSSGSERHIGKKWLAPETIERNKYHFTNFLYRIRLDESKCFPKFIYHFLSSDHETAFLRSISPTSTGLQNLDTDSYEDLIIPFPPLSEQRRIADILSTVNEQIQQIDQIIEKSEELRSGLLQDILHQGLGTHDIFEHRIGPKEVLLPDAWPVQRIDELLSDGADGKPLRGGPPGGKIHKKDRVEGGYKLYTQEIITKRDTSYGDEYLSTGSFNELKAAEPKPGDILITRAGTVGESLVFPKDAERGIIDSALMRLRINEAVCDPHFVSLLIDESYLVEFQVRAMSQSGVVRNLNNGIIKQLQIPVPPLEEQQRIIEMVSKFSDKIEQEKQYKNSFQELKRGLMQDLLTGKVRVPVDTGD